MWTASGQKQRMPCVAFSVAHLGNYPFFAAKIATQEIFSNLFCFLIFPQRKYNRVVLLQIISSKGAAAVVIQVILIYDLVHKRKAVNPEPRRIPLLKQSLRDFEREKFLFITCLDRDSMLGSIFKDPDIIRLTQGPNDVPAY